MESDPAAIAPSTVIIAYPARYYRYTRFIMVAALFIYGLMSVRDGFKVYPAENEAARHRGLAVLPHPALDVPFNQVLGCLLPPLSLLFLAWTVYNSRGSYRFDGTTLEIPGHPPMPLTALRTVDRTKWDRKGIAKIEYESPGSGAIGTFKLDDFIYERQGTDAIFKQIELFFQPPVVETPAETSPPDSHDNAAV